ncbi:MAG: radical SAM protein [Desulfuromonadales bacterium]|nr:radical SAM protein [Desulfuromonadales bacterium]MBN2792009.1 radical SAM protein [Desulfuromonadales bacterium]
MYFFAYEEPVFRPPSEARSLILQITVGCSQNQCLFCGMYKMKQFRIRPVSDIARELKQIPQLHRRQIRRVFLADGDALVYPQKGLVEILDLIAEYCPQVTRVGAYASPRSLTTKNSEELELLREKKLAILYFGLESGDPDTLENTHKGFHPQQMLDLCQTAQSVGMKLSITAILGLAGRRRSYEHAVATAQWINSLSPAYFSLLTMFRRHNDIYFELIEPLTNGETIAEAVQIVEHLNPQKTLLRSNHASNILNLSGSYPEDRKKLINQARVALTIARQHPEWFSQVPDYGESYF